MDAQPEFYEPRCRIEFVVQRRFGNRAPNREQATPNGRASRVAGVFTNRVVGLVRGRGLRLVFALGSGAGLRAFLPGRYLLDLRPSSGSINTSALSSPSGK